MTRNNKRLTTEEFIKRAKKVHGDKYDYSKVIIKNMNSPVTIICKEHGEFLQTPSKHIHGGQKCPDCALIQRAEKRKMTLNEFTFQANEVHDSKYDYSKVIIKNMNSPVTIICKEHGEFLQTPSKHIHGGQKCPDCALIQRAEKRKMTLNEFTFQANEVHDSKYDYSKVIIKNMNSPVTIICKEHGEFLQTPSKHIHGGQGCSRCKNKKEGRIAKYLLNNEVVFRQHKIKRKFYDFFLPKYNLLIERDGEQHYGRGFADLLNISQKENQIQQQTNDKLKTKMAKDAGFKIARIPYWLTKKEEEIEIENILAGKPTYPDVPDLKQEKTRPKPKRNF